MTCNWEHLLARLRDVEAHILAAERRNQSPLNASARNLLHYLALRQLDVRELQQALGPLGLSSLGHSEGAVLANLQAVIRRVAQGAAAAYHEHPAAGWDEAEAILRTNTETVFGPEPAGRRVHIMVTAPEAAIADSAWCERALTAGMSVLRINTAHGSLDDWEKIAKRARAAAARTGCSLRLLVDLAGPKVRTVAPEEGPRVLKLKPKRDAFGRVTEPCRVHITNSATSNEKLPSLTLPATVLAMAHAGDWLAFDDARGRRRRIDLTATSAGRLCGELVHTAYIASDTLIHLHNDSRAKASFTCHDVPLQKFTVEVPVGGRLVLARDPARVFKERPRDAVMGCTLPEIFVALRRGERVLIDDGKIQTRVESVDDDMITLLVERSRRTPALLRGDMGINLPDTNLEVPALTAHDLASLPFIEAHADIVGLSFVRSSKDVRELRAHLRRRDLALLLKIETRGGFEMLPSILLEALGESAIAVMIARGDLAVECGYERLAEVQEEILWLCEAAHVPVVWATQVLDSLAKTGFPTRAEVTDAAMAQRAECVMLNKGPFVAEAITALGSILQRMDGHQYKKRALYRPLHVSFAGDDA